MRPAPAAPDREEEDGGPAAAAGRNGELPSGSGGGRAPGAATAAGDAAGTDRGEGGVRAAQALPSGGRPRAEGSGGAEGLGQDGSDSFQGSVEDGSQDGGGSSQGSVEGGSQEGPRSDHTSNHSGTTVFTSESWRSGSAARPPEDRPERVRDIAPDPVHDDLLAHDLLADVQVIKLKHNKRDFDKKQDTEQTGVSLLADGTSTLHISNVPTYFTQGALLAMLEDLTPAMRGNFDFFHCPWRQEAMRNAGYATINFTDPLHALTFQQAWSNKELCRSGTVSNKRLQITRASLQGLQANLENCFQTATSSMDSRFRPLFRDENGLLNTLAPADPGADHLPRPRGPGSGRAARPGPRPSRSPPSASCSPSSA